MKQRFKALLLGALVTGGAAACSDPLNVTNNNNPETSRVLASASDVEKFIKDSYLTWWNAAYGVEGLDLQMSAMAFEHSPMAANFGMVERSALPRTQIINTVADQFASYNNTMWNNTYSAIRQATDGLSRIDQGAIKFAPDTTNRARAFARFVQGIGHAHLAITFDSAQILTEKDTATEYKGHKEVMAKALSLLDSAIAIASSGTFAPLDEKWINGNALSAADFVKLVYSYKARFRAQDARTPAEAAQVDWAKVLDETNKGISQTFSITMDDNIWTNVNTYYHSFYGAWNQTSMQVLGMADTSGAYQAWIATPAANRQPFNIATPDTRWPRTNTSGAKGSIYVYRGNAGSWVRSDRGTWRWSNYRDERYASFYSNFIGPYPVILLAEMELLKAEALVRLNRSAEALPIINKYRQQGGLPAATASGTSGSGCVPKLPNGQCGDLLEALKYEKRIAIANTVYGGWFFDSRRWGDLPQGTLLEYPVPAREQEVRQKAPYNTGGTSGRSTAPVGTYGY